jgi:hypothetical protein
MAATVIPPALSNPDGTTLLHAARQIKGAAGSGDPERPVAGKIKPMSQRAREDAGEERGGTGRRARASRLGVLFLRLALDALLIDAAWETWRSPSPLRVAVALGTAAFVALTLWVVSQGGRVGGRGWLTDAAAPFILFLAFLVAATESRDGAARGVVMLGRSTDAVLVGAMALLAVLAVLRLAGPSGFKAWWARLLLAGLGIYAAVAFALALRAGIPLSTLVAGGGEWRILPSWLRGARLGAFVLLPLAFAHEFGTAMVRLTLAGLLRWMAIFALGIWIAVNAVSL